MIKLREDNSINCPDVVLNDRAHVSTCDKGMKLRAIFPYIKDYKQPEIEEILIFNDLSVKLLSYKVFEGRRSGKEAKTFFPLDDVSMESERVQKFCDVVFDAATKAEFIASLPKMEVEIQGKTTTVTIPAETKPVLIDGIVKNVEVKKAEKKEVPATKTMILYKGQYYPEDWTG